MIRLSIIRSDLRKEILSKKLPHNDNTPQVRSLCGNFYFSLKKGKILDKFPFLKENFKKLSFIEFYLITIINSGLWKFINSN